MIAPSPPALSRRRAIVAATAFALGVFVASPVYAASASAIDGQAEAALNLLYRSSPQARELAARSRAVLIFPEIAKAGFMVGGMTGYGALKVKGAPAAHYYNISAGSFGFQAGVQKFSYVLFFMTDSALKFLEDSQGWQVGSGPSIVVVDKGMAKSLTSTTLTQDVYSMLFGQKGLMAGAGLEGSKITPIIPRK